MSKEIAERAFDLHSGLSTLQVSEFDDLQLIGMAATVAIHIKGLPEIDYEVMRKVSDFYLSTPSYALEKVLRVLSDVEFVRLVENGRKIEKVIPNIPVFDDVYEVIGKYAKDECHLNSHEQATLMLLEALQDSPRNRETLKQKLGIDAPVFDRAVTLGEKSGVVTQLKARGREMLVSPYYFADNLSGLADAAVSAGASAIESTLKKVKNNQGWPLSLVNATGEIGGTKLSRVEIDLVDRLSQDGVLRPPTIKFGAKSEAFIFTPKPGNGRLNAANREIYERAMALISAVRKGQLLPNEYAIRMPVRLLESFRDKGYLTSNSEASEQYRHLVLLRVAQLRPVSATRSELHLIKTPENDRALSLAINLLRTGELANMEVNQEARLAFTKGEEYVQSLISASEMRKRQKQVHDPQAVHEYEQLILRLE